MTSNRTACSRFSAALCALLIWLTPSDALAQPAFDHSPFDVVLGAWVTDAGVDYAGLKRNRGAFDQYVRALGAVDARTFDGWSRDEQVAYLINAYNAHVLLGVIDQHPIRRSFRLRALVRPANSIWQIHGFFDSIRRRAAGRDLTLDQIEHHWLREVLREPRIHFALVCAARSCPPLRREAYLAARLNAQLDEQARIFLNDPAANRLEPRNGTVRLSSILNWFGEDFAAFAPATGFAGTETERGVLAFAARYVSPALARRLEAGGYTIEYLPYDWTLNEVARLR
jgi:hypothetical protein